MFKFLRSSDFFHGASAATVVVVAALVGQFAARGMTAGQWINGLAAIGAAITLAAILRCWPAKEAERARARIDDR